MGVCTSLFISKIELYISITYMYYMPVFDEECKINSFYRFVLCFLLLVLFNLVIISLMISSNIMKNIGLDNVIGLLVLFAFEIIALWYVIDKHGDLMFSPKRSLHLDEMIRRDDVNNLVENYEKRQQQQL